MLESFFYLVSFAIAYVNETMGIMWVEIDRMKVQVRPLFLCE